MTDLKEKHCKGCEGEAQALTEAQAHQYLKETPQWTLENESKGIKRKVSFKNYYHTMAFVNAVAWMAHAENHHPDLEVAYNQCVVHYTTHALGGLSENDFICASKVDALLDDKQK